MNSLVESKIPELADVCRRYRVPSLEFFGSAASDDQFAAQTSDLDFLVEYLPSRPGEYADAYFGLLEALQELFDRPVDLISARAIRNPYFLESVNRSRRILYAA